jgi:outer membrane protein OmpA-like peptidoglycan-associated protein
MLFEDPGPGTDRESTRWQRQMNVYYNSLNIFADRMRNNPNATVTLLGSAPNQQDGLAQAEAVKSYMVSTFNIAPERIMTKGATRPQNASGTRATPKEDLPFIAEENRRVEILTDNPELLRPVSIRTAQGAPIENDLVLDVRSGVSVTDWKVEVMGNGQNRTYGPYRGMTQRIDAAQILGTQEEGTYTARVTAITTDGSTIIKEIPFTLVRRANSPMNDKRYSILFEYDESKTVQTYEKFLRETVAPQVENGSTVFIYGYTDKVGESEYNSKLSLKRTTAAQQILADAVGSMGRTVTFYTYGFGEGEYLAPFPNESPEGRYYNRTVIVEIVPGSQATSNK